MKVKTGISAVFLAIVATAGAQEMTYSADGRPERLYKPVSGLHSADIKFLRSAQTSNEFEIQTSQLALKTSSDEFVKQFAQQMINDHSSAKNEVAGVASQKNLNVSSDLPKPLQAKLNHLKKLQGSAFDQEFRAIQKSGHLEAMKVFKAEISNGNDQDVKAVAVKLLPSIEMHLTEITSGKTITGK